MNYMPKDMGKKIKILAIIIGVVGALSGLTIAFCNLNNENFFVIFAWIFIAVVFLLLTLPAFAVGSLIEELTEQRENVQKLSDKLAKYSRSVSAESPAEKFAPSGRIKMAKYPTVTTNRPTVQAVKSTTRQQSQADDFTRSLSSKTQNDVTPENSGATPSYPYDNTSTGMASATLKNAFRQTNPETYSPKSFFTTTSLDTFEINRKTNAVTKIIRNPLNTAVAGGLHSAFVLSSGRVTAVGYGTYGQCDVGDWGNIIALSAGNHHTVALRANGTCFAAGYNGYGQCKVEGWKNVCQIATGFGHTVALLENGTCLATGDNAYGQCNVFDWTDIISVVAGNNYTVGLRADGTITAVGANTDGQWGAIKWGSISAVAAGGFHTIGLKTDGTCVAVGNNANNQCDVSNWSNVCAVAAGNYHTVALLSNGKCVAIGYNGYGQCDVYDWDNVVSISAGRNHTIALKSDGTILSTGDNTYGQCNTKNISGIMIPKK